jgi:hypothetical protein
MKDIFRAGFILGLVTVMTIGQGWGGMRSEEPARPVSVLVLLDEWFGDAYFPLKEEIEARGWTMKRVGVDVEYRGCYNKKRDVVLRSDILIQDKMDFAGYDCLIIPSGPQFRKFKENQVILKFVRDAHAAGLLVASFCVGNNVVKAAGLVDFPDGPELFPEKVTLVKERVLLGHRGGGPPPGDGYESAPIKEICDAVAKETASMKRPVAARRRDPRRRQGGQAPEKPSLANGFINPDEIKDQNVVALASRPGLDVLTPCPPMTFNFKSMSFILEE